MGDRTVQFVIQTFTEIKESSVVSPQLLSEYYILTGWVSVGSRCAAMLRFSSKREAQWSASTKSMIIMKRCSL